MIKKKSSNEILLKNTQAKCFLASGHSNLSCRAGASWRKLAISKLEQGNEKHQDFQTFIQNRSALHVLSSNLYESSIALLETLEEFHDYYIHGPQISIQPVTDIIVLKFP